MSIHFFFSFSAFAVLQNKTPLTLNMQGSSANTDSKWTSTIQGFVRSHDVVALQEAGLGTSLPSTAVLLQQYVVANQPYVIDEYQWIGGRVNSVPKLKAWVLKPVCKMLTVVASKSNL